MAWSHTFLILSLILKLKSHSLTLLVFVLSMIEGAHKRYCSHPSAGTHALYISACNNAKSILQLTKNSFINRKCLFFSSNSNSSRGFWHLANNISNNFTFSFFPPLLQLDGSTAVFSFSKAELFVQSLLATLLWMKLDIFLLPLQPLTILSLQLKFFIKTFSMPSLTLILGRLTL